jgi:hypothetical protein
MNLDPVKAFRESPQSKGWSDLAASTQFQSAALAALWQTERKLAVPADMPDAAANFFRIQGAQDFLRNLMSLTDTEAPPPARRSHNLDSIT